MPIIDTPIATTAEGRVLYDNACTVVCVLLQIKDRLVAVRRNNEPGRGLIGLPGGYHMRGESWQEAGAREVREETGFVVDPKSMEMVSLVTDEYGNNLIIAQVQGAVELDPTHDLPEEVQELLFLPEALECTEWAFPRHHDAALHLFRHMNVLGPVSVAS